MTLTQRCARAYMCYMGRHQILAALISAGLLSGAPVPAQENTGRSLMERGAELFLEGLRREMEPTLDDLRGMAEQFGPSMRSFMEEMGPALAELMNEVRDWSAYDPPEILPNGDILIRRKPDPEGETAPDDGKKPAPPEPTDI